MPGDKELILFGKYVHTKFKKDFAIANYNPENGPIPDAGFLIVSHQTTGEKMIVNGYPDEFKKEMAILADVFFYKAINNKNRERKRIPVDQKKVWSAKPTS